MKKICIISTRHISYNPRVLKEADALHDAGYEVSVVTVNNHMLQSEFDKTIIADRKWKLKTVNFRRSVKTEKMKWFRLSLYNKIFKLFQKITFNAGIAERAANKAFGDLKHIAISENADLYITHHAEAIAIGHAAAKTNNVKWGFDAEDFHTGMNETFTQSGDDHIISFLEAKYLPAADYITAASKGIGDAYKEKYGLPQTPNIILNVFPKKNLSPSSVAASVKFYWYSQVIGPTRNLEQLMMAAGKLQGSFELHLRGSFYTDEYRILLSELVTNHQLENKVFFHEPLKPEELIENANQYDVGLALESDVSVNRNICVTNKVFSYLMSGLAIVGTKTIGQNDIFSNFEEAVCKCEMNNVDDLARAMQYFIDHPQELCTAKQAALNAAASEFNWETESQKLLRIIHTLLAA